MTGVRRRTSACARRTGRSLDRRRHAVEVAAECADGRCRCGHDVRGQGQHRRRRRSDHRGCPAFAYVARPVGAPSSNGCSAAGAVFVGKTNLDQFATGLVGTRSPDYGIVRATRSTPRYIAGGSSSGSAVAVATGVVASRSAPTPPARAACRPRATASSG